MMTQRIDQLRTALAGILDEYERQKLRCKGDPMWKKFENANAVVFAKRVLKATK